MHERIDHPQPSRFPANALGFLVLLNLVIFTLQTNGYLLESRIYGSTVSRMQFGSLTQDDLFLRGEWWRLFTYMFVHDIAYPFHIGLNMLMIFMCGWIVQYRLGGIMLIAIYVVGGLIGGLAQVLLHPEPLVGASAAGYALLATVGVLMARQKVTARPGLILKFRVRVKNFVWGVMIVTMITFVVDLVAGRDANIPMISNVGHLAHLGGAAAGFLFCRAFKVGQGHTLASLQAERHAREAGIYIDPMSRLEPSPATTGGEGREATTVTMTEIDPILDKISRHGFLSLTEDERLTLQDGFHLMSRT